MGSLGAGEILLLMVIGLLVFGPNRLPEIARNIGKAVRTFQDESRKAAGTLRDAMREENVPSSNGGTGLSTQDAARANDHDDSSTRDETTAPAGRDTSGAPDAPASPGAPAGRVTPGVPTDPAAPIDRRYEDT